MPVGSIAGASNIGARSYMTKIVGKDEIGKIMSFMTALSTCAPILSSTLSVLIFKYTIDTYPGTVFQFIAFLCLLAVYIMMWIDLFIAVPLQKAVENEHDEKDVYFDENKNEGAGIIIRRGNRVIYKIQPRKENDKLNSTQESEF